MINYSYHSTNDSHIITIPFLMLLPTRSPSTYLLGYLVPLYSIILNSITLSSFLLTSFQLSSLHYE